MKELILSKPSQIGEVKVVLRIIGKLLFFKYNQTKEAQQLINQFRARGVRIEESKEWIKVYLFVDKSGLIKIGDIEIDLDSEPEESIENKLAQFYAFQYIKQGFRFASLKKW